MIQKIVSKFLIVFKNFPGSCLDEMMVPLTQAKGMRYIVNIVKRDIMYIMQP